MKPKTFHELAAELAAIAIEGAAVGLLSDKLAVKLVLRSAGARDRVLKPQEVALAEAGIARARELIRRETEKLERAERAAAQAAAARHNDDHELRCEVIEALVAEGFSRPVAANRTNTEAKMVAEGKRLGVI